MQKIPAFNQNNQALEIEVVRYFKKEDKKYLIFTLGEKDEQDYIKIYVSKILGLNGTLAAYDIIDETEWANVKELIKKIIKTNRENGILDIEDLPMEQLVNIKINGQQVFRLISNLIELLGSNIHIQEEAKADVTPMPPTTTEVGHPAQQGQLSVEPPVVPAQPVQMSVEPPVVPVQPVQENIEPPVVSAPDISAPHPKMKVNSMENNAGMQMTNSNQKENLEVSAKMYQELLEKYQNVLEENTKLKARFASIKAIINE